MRSQSERSDEQFLKQSFDSVVGPEELARVRASVVASSAKSFQWRRLLTPAAALAVAATAVAVAMFVPWGLPSGKLVQERALAALDSYQKPGKVLHFVTETRQGDNTWRSETWATYRWSKAKTTMSSNLMKMGDSATTYVVDGKSVGVSEENGVVRKSVYALPASPDRQWDHLLEWIVGGKLRVLGRTVYMGRPALRAEMTGGEDWERVELVLAADDYMPLAMKAWAKGQLVSDERVVLMESLPESGFDQGFFEPKTADDKPVFLQGEYSLKTLQDLRDVKVYWLGEEYDGARIAGEGSPFQFMWTMRGTVPQDYTGGRDATKPLVFFLYDREVSPDSFVSAGEIQCRPPMSEAEAGKVLGPVTEKTTTPSGRTALISRSTQGPYSVYTVLLPDATVSVEWYGADVNGVSREEGLALLDALQPVVP